MMVLVVNVSMLVKAKMLVVKVDALSTRPQQCAHQMCIGRVLFDIHQHEQKVCPKLFHQSQPQTHQFHHHKAILVLSQHQHTTSHTSPSSKQHHKQHFRWLHCLIQHTQTPQAQNKKNATIQPQQQQETEALKHRLYPALLQSHSLSVHCESHE